MEICIVNKIWVLAEGNENLTSYQFLTYLFAMSYTLFHIKTLVVTWTTWLEKQLPMEMKMTESVLK